MHSGRRLFVFLYAASGAAALVYEVVWTRQLTLQLGHTVAAASTVLAAFMGGLALGAWIAGRRFDSHRSGELPLALARQGLLAYAILEVGVAAAALLLPFALAASVPLLARAYADGTAPATFAVVRVAISLLLVGVPAAAMGATFPIATNWFASDAADTGVLYAANTGGAAIGAIAAGFFLIPAFGLRATTWVGVALNLIAASGAWWLSTKRTTIIAEHAEPAEKRSRVPKNQKSLRVQRVLRSTSSSSLTPAPGLACAAAALSGFAALTYEVGWTRLLALVIGPTTYAFATMAAAFISGLAIGSAAGTRLARRTPRPAVWLAAMLIVSALAATAAAWIAATRMPLVVAAQVADPAVAFTSVVLTQALATAVLLLPMTLALGATFPLALAVASGATSTVGRDAARVYTANTLGAIAGSLVAGFLLVPTLGLRLTFEAAAILGAVGGAVCLGLARGPERAALHGPRTKNGPGTKDGPGTRDQGPRTWVRPAIAGGAAVAAIALLPPWDRELLASGAYKYAPYLGAQNFELVLRAGDLEYYKEGAAATVSVRQLTGTTSLAIDGKVDASNAGDMLTQRLLGLLPVLLHGQAEDIAIIGLGSGVTVGSALAPGTVRRADVVEISPEVVEASHFFDRESGAPLSKPGVRLIVGDGRSHLLLTPRRYDVIISEPSNPWMAGVAALFTREFFEAARTRLKPGGLLCQWAHTYDISADDLRSIVRTFASVFPQGTMWLVGEGDLLLIGTPGDGITARIDRIAQNVSKGATAETLATVGIAERSAAFDLLSLFAGGPGELARYAAGARVQTDDHTALEYSAPRGIYGRNGSENAAAIRALAGDAPPAVRSALDAATDADWASRGRMLLKADAYVLAYDALRRAVALNPRNAGALTLLSDAAAGARRQEDERQFLTAIAEREPTNAAVRVELSRVLASGGAFDPAIRMVTGALQLAPDDQAAGEQLASIVADAGDAERLTSLAESLAARFPGRPDPQYYRASALFMRGRTEDALTAVRHVTDGHPEHARAQNLLGAACATLGRRACAQSAFEASIKANPRDPSTYINLAQLSLDSADPNAAARYFADALSIDPASTAARDGLAHVSKLLKSDSK
jgi:spermidine synthase